MRIEPNRIRLPNLPPKSSALAQSTETRSSPKPEDYDSGSAPPPNTVSPWLLYLVQDPEVMLLYLNLNNQPLPPPETPPQD